MKEGSFRSVISTENDSFKGTLLKLAAFLVILQLIRAGVMYGEWFIIKPGASETMWSFTCILNFLIVGALLLFIYCPSADSMSAYWVDIQRGHKKIYITAGILVLLLIGSTTLLDPRVFIENVSSALMIPIFEELIFRGWAWQKLECTMKCKYPRLAVLLIISLLFGLWHLGYADYVLLKVIPMSTDMPSIALMLFFKVLMGFAIGLATGFLRLKTGKVYGSIILHSIINIFGR